MVAGLGLHGDNQIWYSRGAWPNVGNENPFTVPVGTVATEFDNNGDTEIDGLAVMIKKEPGYDSENGIKYDHRDVDGNILEAPAAGKNPGCISCHVKSKKIRISYQVPTVCPLKTLQV